METLAIKAISLRCVFFFFLQIIIVGQFGVSLFTDLLLSFSEIHREWNRFDLPYATHSVMNINHAHCRTLCRATKWFCLRSHRRLGAITRFSQCGNQNNWPNPATNVNLHHAQWQSCDSVSGITRLTTSPWSSYWNQFWLKRGLDFRQLRRFSCDNFSS